MPPNDNIIENEEAANEQFRTQLQCFLAQYWDVYAKMNEEKKYSSFVNIGKTGDRLSPNQVVERLTAIPGLSSLMRCPPSILATLQPTVRLFKVVDGQDTETITEFIFQDHLTNDAVNTMTRSSAERGQGVGLMSMEWEKTGGEGRSNAQVIMKMKLRFDSIMDLVAPPGPGGEPWLSLITQSPSSLPDQIRQPATEGQCGQANQPATGQPFKIRCVIGYAPPETSMWQNFPGGKGYTANDIAKIYNATQAAHTTLYLMIWKHSIELQQGGGLVLECEYHAALEGVLNDPRADVFLLGAGTSISSTQTDFTRAIDDAQRASNEQARQDISESQGQNNRVAELDREARDMGRELSRLRCQRDRLKARDGDDADTSFADQMIEAGEARLDEIAAAREAELGRRYRWLLNELEKNNRIFMTKVNREFLGRTRRGQRTASAAARARYRSEVVARSIRNQQGRLSDRNHDVVQQTAEGADGDNARERADDRQSQIDDARAAIDADQSAGNFSQPNELEVHYFYYGDLLDIAMRVLKPPSKGGTGADPKNELRCVVGPYSWTDMGSGEQRSCNLADIPISLENFQVWFLDNVIKKMKDKYMLKDFIKDSINKLVSNALKPICFGMDHGLQGAPQIGLNVFEAPMMQDGDKWKDRILPAATSGAEFGNARIDLDGIEVHQGSIHTEGTAMGSYLMLFCSSASSAQLKSDEVEDEKMGRYWLRFGTDSGMVKEIKFKKQDSNGRREMNIERHGGGSFAQLHEIYDADITLFGCPIFSPGGLLYVDPASVGIGQPTMVHNLAQTLGLGGYYMIHKVSASIEPGKFETKLETKFEAPGDVCNSGRGAPPANQRPNPASCDDVASDGTPAGGAGGEQPATPPPAGAAPGGGG